MDISIEILGQNCTAIGLTTIPSIPKGEISKVSRFFNRQNLSGFVPEPRYLVDSDNRICIPRASSTLAPVLRDYPLPQGEVSGLSYPMVEAVVKNI